VAFVEPTAKKGGAPPACVRSDTRQNAVTSTQGSTTPGGQAHFQLSLVRQNAEFFFFSSVKFEGPWDGVDLFARWATAFDAPSQ